MENKRSHLEMVQGIVNRLSHNSFLLKGWSVVLISAMFALAAKDSQIIFVYLAYFPAIVFWGLDGYFLHQEKLFRALYDYARALKEEDIDFSMDTSKVKHNVEQWLSVTFSKTLVAFHGVILISIILVTAVSIYLQQGGVQNGS
ncbi:MAG: hypothetical protein H8D23_37790 [Candidatus Brocadiales bacterium]|nr:hypothetical protein [Candidatus Brocadiales bacterium]